MSFSVPLLPLCQTSHVSWGGFTCGPKVGSNGEEVEREDKSDRPFERSGCRCNVITCIGRVTVCRRRVSLTLSSKVGKVYSYEKTFFSTHDTVGNTEANSKNNGEQNDDELQDGISLQRFAVWVLFVQRPLQ